MGRWAGIKLMVNCTLFLARNLSHMNIVRTYCVAGTFKGENFCGFRELPVKVFSMKIESTDAQVFSLENFPLYGIPVCS
jgi:hypothetical protein